MLDNPKHGWSRITIGDWSDRCSYLNDVPEELCTAVKESIRNRRGIAHFDAEGYEYTMIFDTGFNCVHIITNNEDGEWVYKTIECNISTLALELANDILVHIDSWAEWFDGDLYIDEPAKRYIDLSRDCLRLIEITKKGGIE